MAATVEFEPFREVRFGVVLYGGVSLAVYINGVVRELYSLVRATAPELDRETGEPLASGTLKHRDDELLDAEPVYRKLGRLYKEKRPPRSDEGPVRTRFVVDIISGSSAGGINGIHLAKALVNQQDLRPLQSLWVEKGDFSELFNDRPTRRLRKDRLPQLEPTEGLLSGDVMYLELLASLDAMDDAPSSAQATSPYVSDLDLVITATDLRGVPEPVRLTDMTIKETKHRHTFHFTFGDSSQDRKRNDFTQEMNELLAFAGRATSAYPFAFVPARLADIARVVRARRSGKTRPDPLDDRWRPWFRAHRRTPGFDYQNVSFGDGGDMDNKPFEAVIATLPSRTSSTPVDRRVFYVEPDPGDVEEDERAAPRPNVIDSVTTAVSLGRVEDIRTEIDRLAKLSEVRDRIAAATEEIEARYLTGVGLPAEATAPPTTEDWLDEPPEVLAARGLPYAAYLRLRVEVLVTEYARALVGLPWEAAETLEAAAMRALVAHWVERTYADPYAVGPSRPTTKHFLRGFDLAFRIRRLMFVAARLDHLYADPKGTTDNERRQYQQEVRRIKAQLGRVERSLRVLVPASRTNPADPPPDFPLSTEDAQYYSDDPSGWVVPTWSGRRDKFCAVADRIEEYLAHEFARASKKVRDALAVDATSEGPVRDARRDAGRYYERFANFDQVTFPLHAVVDSSGEVNPIEVHRISPLDAASLVDTRPPAESGKRRREKVAGARLAHFGGFLDRAWRANDVMWGRLDTAERLVDCLLEDSGVSKEQRKKLVAEAHAAILATEWYAPGKPGERYRSERRATTPDEKLELFREEFALPDWPEPSTLLKSASRAARVTNSILEGVVENPDDSPPPGTKILHRALGVVGWLLTAVTTVAVPRQWPRTPVRALSSLSVAVGALLAALGSAVNWDSATGTGWPMMGIGGAGLFLSLVTRIARRRAKWALALAGIVVVLGLAGYGGWQLWDRYGPDDGGSSEEGMRS